MTRPFRSLVLALSGFLAASGASLAQDSSEMIVRLNRLEGQLRQMSGQVEQLQFENRQLKDQFRKFQEDVEFRFQEKGGRAASPAPSAPMSPAAKPARRSDAFDPATDPAAPGAPRTLGSASGPVTSPSPPPGRRDAIAGIIDEDEDDAPQVRRPLDLGAAGGRPLTSDPGRPPASDRLATASEPAPSRGPSVASTGTGDPRSDYDIAYAFLIQRQYDRAEMGFRGYLQSHPRDRLVPDATYWLGESYLQRNRPREAAEQFLKVSTEFSRSTKAPDALLKLGVSLAALGAKDQACATFAELERKFPTASPSIKQGVDREQKRVRCAA